MYRNPRLEVRRFLERAGWREPERRFVLDLGIVHSERGGARRRLPRVHLDVRRRAQQLSGGPVVATASCTPVRVRRERRVEHQVARVDVAVCGAHLDGLPLNWQLVERGGKLVEKTLTMSCYRLYALPGGPPLRPGLLRDENAGTAIEVEVWSLPATEFGSFVAAVPRPLGIGQVELESGCWVSGFLCEPAGLEGATDISSLGSWRAYLAMQ